MKSIVIFYLMLLCVSTSFASESIVSEEDFIRLIVRIGCLQKTHVGLSESDLKKIAGEEITKMNIKGYTFEKFLSDRNNYMQKEDFMEKYGLRIAIKINQCVQETINKTPLKTLFYGIPTYEGSRIIEVTDHPSSAVATLRLISHDSVDKVAHYYKGKMSVFSPDENKFGDLIRFQYKDTDKNKIIMIEEAPDGTEITLTADK